MLCVNKKFTHTHKKCSLSGKGEYPKRKQDFICKGVGILVLRCHILDCQPSCWHRIPVPGYKLGMDFLNVSSGGGFESSCVHSSGYNFPTWISFSFFFFFNQSSVLYTSLYTCQSQSPNSAHHHPHPTAVFPCWCPYVWSLHLCLNFCPANRFICTIFLGFTYMR